MCSIRQFKALVFDMDGLIFDSERLFMRVLIEEAKKRLWNLFTIIFMLMILRQIQFGADEGVVSICKICGTCCLR